MPKKSCRPKDIISKLGEADIIFSQGNNVTDIIGKLGTSGVAHYRCRKEYGGMKSFKVKRLKELEKQNHRLRKAVSGLTLDKLILQEAAKLNCPHSNVCLPNKIIYHTKGYKFLSSLQGTAHDIG